MENTEKEAMATNPKTHLDAETDYDLVRLFCRLASTQSPSLFEANVARYIKEELRRIGVKTYSDKSSKYTKSNTGNIVAVVGKGKPVLLFVAHMDTVEDGKKQIKPIIKRGVIKSDGSTIVGSDDKSGITAMVGALSRLKGRKDIPRSIFVFSTAEESGDNGMGISYLKLKEAVDFAFSVDGSDKPGTFIKKALGFGEFNIKIRGRAAHAASKPEKGANAIKAAGIIIAKLNIGKFKNGSSLSIAKISGGGTTSAVVPDGAELNGVVRGFNVSDMRGIRKHIMRVVSQACIVTGCKYKISFSEKNSAVPFDKPDEKIVALAKLATESAGLRFNLKDLYSPSEVNALYGMGYNALGMCRGGRNAHSVKEYVEVKEIYETAKLLTYIITMARNIR